MLGRLENRVVVENHDIPRAGEGADLSLFVEVDQGVGRNDGPSSLGAERRYGQELVSVLDAGAGETDRGSDRPLSGSAVNADLVSIGWNRGAKFFFAFLFFPNLAPFSPELRTHLILSLDEDGVLGNIQPIGFRSIGFPFSDVVSQVKRSEEHTSELQSPDHLVCRLL